MGREAGLQDAVLDHLSAWVHRDTAGSGTRLRRGRTHDRREYLLYKAHRSRDERARRLPPRPSTTGSTTPGKRTTSVRASETASSSQPRRTARLSPCGLPRRRRPTVAALVLASANVKPADPGAELLLWPWPVPSIILSAIRRVLSAPCPRENDLDARYWTKRYPSRALVTMMATVKLARKVRLEGITVPSLWIYTNRDDVVSIPELKKYYARIGSARKRLVEIPNAAGHVLAGAIMSPATTGEMASLVSSFLRETVIQGK